MITDTSASRCDEFFVGDALSLAIDPFDVTAIIMI